MNLEFSGIPVRVNNMVKAALSLEFTSVTFRKRCIACDIDNCNASSVIIRHVVYLNPG